MYKYEMIFAIRNALAHETETHDISAAILSLVRSNPNNDISSNHCIITIENYETRRFRVGYDGYMGAVVTDIHFTHAAVKGNVENVFLAITGELWAMDKKETALAFNPDYIPSWYVETRPVPVEEKQEQIADHLHVSKRNSKLGNIKNMSLTPGVSCSRKACETCHVDGCYAMDSYNQYPDTRKAWDDNTNLALYDLDIMEECFMRFFQDETGPNKRKPMEYFRIHVGGDFITRDYAMMWYRIARAFPMIHFLAFTKQFDIIRGIPFNTLPNFVMRLSDWPGVEIPADLLELYPVAYMDDGTRPADTFPENCLECPGHCEDCMACFAKEVGSTKFVKHGSHAKKRQKEQKGKAGEKMILLFILPILILIECCKMNK